MSTKGAPPPAAPAAVGPVARSDGFAWYCALQGFDLPGFDAWLQKLEPCGAKLELGERRGQAVEAMLANNHDAALRRLEWMLSRWRAISAKDARDAEKAATGKLKGKRAASSNKARAKLGTPEEVRAAIDRLMAENGCIEVAAKDKLARLKGVKRPAVDKKLRAFRRNP